jgi:Na+/melibiose symporter-like transporter
MIIYPISCIPEVYIIDNISIYIGLSIPSLLLIVGSFLKVFIKTSLIFAYIGQLLAALFHPAILYSPEKIARLWFDDENRILVISTCQVSKFLGIIFGYLTHIFIIHENTVNPKMWRDSFEKYLLIEFIISLISGIIFLIFMRSKPKGASSLPHENNSQLALRISNLRKNTNYIKLLISLTCIVGFLNIFGTIYNSYMNLYGVKDSTASFTIASSFFLGIILVLIICPITNKNQKYKLPMIICNIISLLAYVITTILMETINKKNLGLVSFICYTLIIGSSAPIYICGMNFVSELTYLNGESVSGRVIITCSNIMGIFGIIICDTFRTYLSYYKFFTNIFCIVLLAISFVSLLFINSKSIRKKKDIGQDNSISIDKGDEKEGLL